MPDSKSTTKDDWTFVEFTFQSKILSDYEKNNDKDLKEPNF